MPVMTDVLGLILGGGRGVRLHPLTRGRAKPAVPIAGKYRLIDIPISNCINSGINRIAVLTQYNSVSLHHHIARTYMFDTFHHGWVQILAAEQTPPRTAGTRAPPTPCASRSSRSSHPAATMCSSWPEITSIAWTMATGQVSLGPSGGYYRGSATASS